MFHDGPSSRRRERIELAHRGPDPDLQSDTTNDAAPTVLWAAADTIVVARAGTASVISLTERRILREIEIGPVRRTRRRKFREAIERFPNAKRIAMRRSAGRAA